MPSTYSPNLALELMTTGEDNNTWGDKTNNNLGTLLEQAIVGSATINMVNSDQVISMTNGVSATARCIVISCTSALSAQRSLIVPDIEKPYIISNDTTGGFGVLVTTAAGTGIVVNSGERRFLYADGTNVVEMLSSIGDLFVDGTFSVGGKTITLG